VSDDDQICETHFMEANEEVFMELLLEIGLVVYGVSEQ
jgi:hypothetical protein